MATSPESPTPAVQPAPRPVRRPFIPQLGLAGKLGLIIVLILFLLAVPVAMVQDVIDERADRQLSAVAEIGASWGRPQTLAGPILVVPVETTVVDKDGKTQVQARPLVILPDDLTVVIQVAPEVRARGIFEAVVYTSAVHLSGTFNPPADIAGTPLWREALLVIGLSDARGLGVDSKATWGSAALTLEPDSRGKIAGAFMTALSAPLGHVPPIAAGQSVPFTVDFGLKGSDRLLVAPFGRTTRVTMAAPWASPSFVGSYLPESHDIAADQFEASWRISYFGRGYPQTWTVWGAPHEIGDAIDGSAFGARFVQPVDAYQMTQRSAKYAELFLAFTFLVYFLFEIRGTRVSVVQYGLVGLSMCLFYLLLLSLSEVLGFGWAYAISTGAVVAQSGAYTVYVTHNAPRSAAFAGMVAAVYGYLFVLLMQETYALLGGAIGLFVLLSLLMYATRNVDWSMLSTRGAERAAHGG